jgi:hypothetical protein
MRAHSTSILNKSILVVKFQCVMGDFIDAECLLNFSLLAETTAIRTKIAPLRQFTVACTIMGALRIIPVVEYNSTFPNV